MTVRPNQSGHTANAEFRSLNSFFQIRSACTKDKNHINQRHNRRRSQFAAEEAGLQSLSPLADFLTVSGAAVAAIPDRLFSYTSTSLPALNPSLLYIAVICCKACSTHRSLHRWTPCCLASTALAMWAVADVNQYFSSHFNTICRFRDPAMYTMHRSFLHLFNRDFSPGILPFFFMFFLCLSVISFVLF